MTTKLTSILYLFEIEWALHHFKEIVTMPPSFSSLFLRLVCFFPTIAHPHLSNEGNR